MDGVRRLERLMNQIDGFLGPFVTAQGMPVGPQGDGTPLWIWAGDGAALTVY